MKRTTVVFARPRLAHPNLKVAIYTRPRPWIVLVLMVATLCSCLPVMARDDPRYDQIGNKIQCSCGCGQILIKCNHVGCQSSDTMIRQLRTALTTYSKEEDVLNWFRRNYGMTVVVEPAKHGFELMIWIVPPLLVASALLLVFFIIRKWRMRTAPVTAAQVDPKLEALRQRARKETEL